jgi:TolA-binding protein
MLTACPPQKKGDRPWWAPPPADGSKPKAKPKKKPRAKPPKKSSKPAKSSSKPPAPSAAVDAEAQQAAYDTGMKHYTDENYAEAQKAWKEAIRWGPNTPLADQARENIKKTDQILKTLQEMEK